MKGNHVVPLYFHVENNQFDFGAGARDRFFQHDPHAYGDYFELIKDPSQHFTLHNSAKRVKQLLYYGIEQFLSHFLNTVLYKSDAIESYRAAFPLKFIFEPDIAEPERNLVAGLFTEAGYRAVSVLSYSNLLLEHLRHDNFIGKKYAVLMLTGLADNLYLDLYEKGAETPVAASMIPHKGADPRINILAGMIVGYIQEQNSYLSLDTEREIAGLLPQCAALLAENKRIVTGEAELSNGSKFWFRINLKSVEDSLQYYSGDLIVSTAIDELLQSLGIRTDELIVLLCSEQIMTSYFTDRLLKPYPNVKNVTTVHIDGAMQLIFSKVPPTAPAPARPLFPPKLPPLPDPKQAIKQPPPMPAAKNPTSEKPRTVIPPPLPPIRKKT
ncbi:hypothetical protein [Mucilaginibacter calamicampi]